MLQSIDASGSLPPPKTINKVGSIDDGRELFGVYGEFIMAAVPQVVLSPFGVGRELEEEQSQS